MGGDLNNYEGTAFLPIESTSTHADMSECDTEVALMYGTMKKKSPLGSTALRSECGPLAHYEGLYAVSVRVARLAPQNSNVRSNNTEIIF